MISLLHKPMERNLSSPARFRNFSWLTPSVSLCLSAIFALTPLCLAESSFVESLPVFKSLGNLPTVGWNSSPPQTEPMSSIPSSDPLSAILLEYGCLGRAKRILQRGQRQILINIYDFSTAAGAYGAYCYLRQGSSNVVTRGDASSEDQRSIFFCKENFFVSIYSTASDDDEESKSLVTKISNLLAATIPSNSARVYGAKPEILSRLPTFEVVKGSQKLIMGPLAAKKFLSAPYVTTLGSEKMQMGAIADYQLQEPDRERLKLLIAQYSNPIAAMHVYSQYVSELEAQHKPENLDGLTYQSSVYKTASGHILCQLRGRTLLIITGARKKNSLAALAGQIL